MDKVHLKLPLADVDMGEKRLLKTSKLRQNLIDIHRVWQAAVHSFQGNDIDLADLHNQQVGRSRSVAYWFRRKEFWDAVHQQSTRQSAMRRSQEEDLVGYRCLDASYGI